ncbi:hypothetical protein C8F01DRAFT_1233686 [Mycena amicta]|nr:hypothetical protein C8F01DRAFT_1233686 [Mycena amicta]
MDPNFTFPRQRPHARPTPVQAPSEPVNRESNALRASVLDAAMELGFGSNKTVANWMFSNTLDEEEEEEVEEDSHRTQLSPISDDYAPYSTPPTSTESYSPQISSTTSPQVHFPPIPAAPAQAPNKLRKQRRENGYESDGGYVSDGGKKPRVSKPTKALDPATVFPISEPMELIPLSKEERKRKKKSPKGAKDIGAETDTEELSKSAKAKSTKKNKKGLADAGAGYETDDGYVSSSGKPKTKGRRFFSLRKKSDSASEPAPEREPVPPMPEREVFNLPIASRFGTTLGPSPAPSRAQTPLVPPSRPFASASGSSSPSSASSLLTPGDQETFSSGSPLINAGSSRFTAEDSVHPHEKSPSASITPTDQLPTSQPVSPQQPHAKSKFFISFPLTRTAEQGSPPEKSKGKNTPAPIFLSPNPPNSGSNSRSASPGPSPMGSPFVLLTPINTSTNMRAHSPAPSASTEASFAPVDYIVPSRSASPLPPSPNVLSYYDVAPPSPPPSGPLPRPPPPSSMRDAGPGPGVARLRSMSRDRAGRREALSPLPPDSSRSVSPSPVSSPWSAGGLSSPMVQSPGGARSPLSPVQRGRAAPFPSQPISQARPAAGAGVGPGLAARAKVQRYRDLYAIQIPDSPDRHQRGETSVDIRVDEGDDDEMEDPEIAGVLGRFRDPIGPERDAGNTVALERNNSGALRPGARMVRFSPPSPDDDDASRYPDDELTAGRRTMYRFDNSSSGNEDEDEAIGTRDTVYSDYSRASFMDTGKSQAVRGRLVDRVGTMFDQNGRPLRAIVPPVPKLPPELLSGGNRF